MASRGKNARLCGSLAAFCAVTAASCSAPDKGSLILAISTDMQAPQDISIVSVFVSNSGVPKFDYLGAVSPDGSVTLPATLALVESDNPNDEIHIRVTGFKGQEARVMRDVLTHIPHQRSSLLRLPLNFLDEGSVKGTLPQMYVPGRLGMAAEGDTMFNPVDPVALTWKTCDASRNQTSFAGGCIDAHVDSAQLPAWSETAVYGEGGTSTTPSCFDVTKCFAKAKPITTVDMNSCSFPLPLGANGAHWNCALATTDRTGACDASGLCLVPLETDTAGSAQKEGFHVANGNTIQMVPGVCNKIRMGAQLYADNSAACAQKIEGAPVCQPAEAVDAGAPLSDAGTVPMGDGSADASLDATVAADGGAPPVDAATDGGTVCQPPSGTTGGLGPGAACASPDAGTEGGIPACGGSCGSRSCAADPTTGQPVCQPSSGCHTAGESCITDSDCCGFSPEGGTSVTCSMINACGVGICSNPTGCQPNGSVCHLAGATSCNVPCSCCSGSCSLANPCRPDNMGVPRCAAPTCLPGGSTCATSADCCNTPCVPSSPDAGLTSMTCYPVSCVPTGGPCTTYADCCSGLACTGNTCVTHP
jgi:hypothetical protein